VSRGVNPLAVPKASTNVSLRTVATAAKVSVMTVSRVMRNFPRISPTVRRRVQAALQKLGYRPDPQIAQLMARVRDHRRRRVESVIAVVRDDTPEDELHDPIYRYIATDDIQRRAEQHGYRAEEFFLGRGGITPKRLSQILAARGIAGLLLSPQSSRNSASQLDYSRFAAAAFGFGLPRPALHVVSANMTHGILDAATRLSAGGYKRIGLAITKWIDTRSNHTYSGAMLKFQQTLSARLRVPILLFPDNTLARGASIFCAWFREHRPDVVITFDAHVPDWLTRRLGRRIPEDVGLVVHDLGEGMTGFAGIYHRRPHIATAAVDMVATQLMQNEFGVPEVPRHILILPAWVPGPTVQLSSRTPLG